MKYLTIFLMTILLVLAACSSEQPTTAPDADAASNTTSQTTEAGFTATISGAVDTTVTGNGYLTCDSSLDELAISANMSLTNNVLVSVSYTGVTVDTSYNIGVQNQSDNIFYVGEEMMEDLYDANPAGTITLTAIPTKIGDRIAGSFDVTVSNQDDETLNITGVFDFIIPENTSFDCS